jgi:hypothetical protein
MRWDIGICQGLVGRWSACTCEQSGGVFVIETSDLWGE